MQKLVALALLLIGFSIALPAPPAVPEISPTAGTNVLALLAGGCMILRSRKK